MRSYRLVGVAFASAVVGCVALDHLTTGDGPQPPDGEDASSTIRDATYGDAVDALSRRDTSASTSPYADAVMSDTPLMYLRFGEAAGATQLKDETGHIQPQVLGVPIFGRAGAIMGDPNTAVKLSNAGFDCGSAFDFLGRQPFTIEVWAKAPNPISAGEPFQFIVRKEEIVDAAADAVSPNSYALYYFDQNIRFQRRADGGARQLSVFRAAETSPSFHHYAIVYTGSSLYLYVDGFIRTTDSFGVTDGLGSMDGHFLVGLRNVTQGFLDGELDELAVYDKEVLGPRIKAHYDIAIGNHDF